MTDFPFSPSITAAYQFQPMLDGRQYLATVKWNISRQDYYFFLTTQAGVAVITRPLIGSPTGIAISSASFDSQAFEVTISTEQPHGYAVGSSANLTVSGMLPAAYNGTFACYISGPDEVTYPLSTNPGAASALGTLSYDVNLVNGYFQTSTLVYREQAARFEVLP